METVSKIVEGKVLSKVIELPKSLHDILVKVTITPATENTNPTISRSELRKKLGGSHTEHISGILKAVEDVDIEKLREERRIKRINIFKGVYKNNEA